MRSSYSLSRLIICYALCILFFCYSFVSPITIKHKKTPPFTDIFANSGEIEEKNEENSQKNTQNESKNQNKTENLVSESKVEQTKKEENKTQSSTASAAAVKGKIVTRYISPYTAPVSYNGVYLKNYTSEKVDLKSLLSKNLSFKIEKNNQPQVLIIHTHTTETFMDTDEKYYTEDFKSRTTNNNKNMAKIGSIIAEKLNKNGIKTIHDKTHHDYPEYTGSYGRAAQTINKYLKQYPSIKIVLDLHRDAVSDNDGKAKLVTEIGGKKAAQVMLVMGSQTGGITNFPNWRENLSLAVKLHQTIEAKYPTLARPIMLMSKKYNQNLTKGSLLIEFGTDVNTLDEAKYSAELVGNSLVSLLNTLK